MNNNLDLSFNAYVSSFCYHYIGGLNIFNLIVMSNWLQQGWAGTFLGQYLTNFGNFSSSNLVTLAESDQGKLEAGPTNSQKVFKAANLRLTLATSIPDILQETNVSIIHWPHLELNRS